MNKRIAIITSVIVLLIAVGVGYLLATGGAKTDETMPRQQGGTSQTAGSQPAKEPAAPAAAPGAYIDYKEGVIASTAGTKLLFFYAPWCPQCRALEADIKEKGVPTGVTIIKVDYDSSQALRQKYGVTLQTTLVRVDDNGNLVEKFVAYDDPTVNAVVKELL